MTGSLCCTEEIDKSTVIEKIKILKKTFFSLFGHAHCMWKFSGQGSNPHHSSDPSYSNDNTDLLTP